jgi:hypothetical protein
LKKLFIKKKGWWVAQGVGPEFKLQCHKKKKKKKKIQTKPGQGVCARG